MHIPRKSHRGSNIEIRLWLTSLPEYLRSVSNPSTAACILHGFDISPDQFPYSTKTIDPSNEVQFIVQDIRDPFPESYHGKYDLVNVSHLIAGLREEEYESAVRNLFDILSMFILLLYDCFSSP